MRWFGGQLAQAGYSVVGIRLFAHATQPEDMFRARARDWVASVEDGYHLLRGLSEQVVVMGLSLGGILSLHFSSRFEVRGVVAMSVPYILTAPWVKRIRPLLPAVSQFVPFMDKGAPDWRDPRLADDHLEYPRHPVRAVASLMDVHNQMLKRLPLITAPALMIASHGDVTAPPWQHRRCSAPAYPQINSLCRSRTARHHDAYPERHRWSRWGSFNPSGHRAGARDADKPDFSPVILPSAEPSFRRGGRAGVAARLTAARRKCSASVRIWRTRGIPRSARASPGTAPPSTIWRARAGRTGWPPLRMVTTCCAGRAIGSSCSGCRWGGCSLCCWPSISRLPGWS
jgi:esterase/lipase